MSKLKQILITLTTFAGLILFAEVCQATDYYIAQNVVGVDTGADCSNAHSSSWFNTSGSWGAAAGQIKAGDTVHLCGTYTGTAGQMGLTFQGSGTSGSPITLKFESGAQMTSPYWGNENAGAINASSRSYIVIDGGTNGVIQNTANGTNLTYHLGSNGVYLNNCTYSEVKNLTIRNIYVNAGSSSGATDTGGLNTAGIHFMGNATGSSADGNVISSVRGGIRFEPDCACDASNANIYNNTISDMAWGIQFASGNAATTMSNVKIYNNTITNWTNWQYPTGSYHTDGMILYNGLTAATPLFVSVYNNYIYGDLGVGSPTAFIYCTTKTTCTIFNNLLINTGNPIYGIIWLGSTSGNHQIYNNTIIGHASGDNAITVTGGAGSLGTTTIKNNIGIDVSLGVHLYNTTADIAASDYNVWQNFSNAAPSMGVNDTWVTYSQWQGYGLDTHSSVANPNLDGTWHLQTGSSAIGAGANLSSLSTGNTAGLYADKAGKVRSSTGAWDIGAYNFVSVSGTVSSKPKPPVLRIVP